MKMEERQLERILKRAEGIKAQNSGQFLRRTFLSQGSVPFRQAAVNVSLFPSRETMRALQGRNR